MDIIEISGHQLYYEYRGEIIKYIESVENFNGKYFQVPAVIIKTKDGIKIVNLKQYLKTIELKKDEKAMDEKTKLERFIDFIKRHKTATMILISFVIGFIIGKC